MAAAVLKSYALRAGPQLLPRLRARLDDVPRIALDRVDRHIDAVQSEIDAMLRSAAASPASTPAWRASQIDAAFFVEPGCPDYAYLQLAGPESDDTYYFSERARFGLSYQGPGLTYLGHEHAAVELYTVLDGESRTSWWTDRAPAWEERAHSFHEAHETHAMSTCTCTSTGGGLYFWSWTGDLTLDILPSADNVQEVLKRGRPARDKFEL